MDQPHFGVTANLEITAFLQLVRERPDLRFTPALVYLIARVANELPHFRWRIRGEEVVEHESVRPSFTVPTRESEVFSFCTVAYDPEAMSFHDAADRMMRERFEQPSMEDEPGMDDYLYLSAFPWASFTNVQHAMHYSPADSVPRIVWGKYFKQGDEVMLPLSVQAHHAVVDGSDLGRYFRELRRLLADSDKIF